MNVLVTGGAGYIGSTVVTTLLSKGWNVSVLDNLRYGGSALLSFWTNPKFEFFYGDVRDRACVKKAVRNMDAVIHLAAIVGDPACSKEPQLAKEVNHAGSMLVFLESNKAKVKRFVFASTCSNYGKMDDPESYITEKSPLTPLSLYAKTKVDVENRLLDVRRQTTMCVTVLRFATVYGVSPRMRFDLTVNEFTLKLLTMGHLQIYGEQFWRPYIHVVDVARAIEKVLSSPKKTIRKEVFNVGNTAQNFRKGHLAQIIRKCVDATAADIEFVKQKDDPRDYRVSFKKIRKSLGFVTTKDIKDGVQEIKRAIQQGVLHDFKNPTYRN